MNLPQFEFRMESGAIALRDGFVVNFFLPRSHVEISNIVERAVGLYLGLPGIPTVLGTLDGEGYPLMLGAGKLPSLIKDKLREGLTEAELQVIDSTDGTSSFSIRYHGFDLKDRSEKGWRSAVSGIRFTFPTSYLGEEGLLEIFQFSNNLAEMLPFSFGYVSPAFLYHEGVGEPAAFETIRGLCKRFLCLDIPFLLLDCLEVGSGPKGAYWGNYLSSSIVEKLGGEILVKKHFEGHDVRLRAQGNGAMSIYLGRSPIAGDVNRNENVEAHKVAFRIFAREMVQRTVPYMDFDEETMHHWLYRFADAEDE